jgi:alginate export protein
VRRLGSIFLFSALLILISGIAAGNMFGQEKPVSLPRPLYPLPRYDEDWSVLSDPSQHNDFWDPIKFIPLSHDGAVFLSLGGEIRETYERFHNTSFGLSPDDPGGYLLQRYLFHVDIHAGQRFRFFGELSSSLEDGRTGGPRPVIDEDKLDVHQGFFDVLLLMTQGDSSFTARIGRQELAIGSGRLVALREGPNVPLSFDGIRISFRSPAWQIDGFATRPVQSKSGIFDDLPQHDFAFWGAYASHALAAGPGKPKIDFYYLGLDRKRVAYNQGAAHEKRHTLGARLWGQRGGWSYDTEATYQFGEFGTGTINAWRVAVDNAYTFSSLRWHPRIGFTADVASGDGNPATANLQTFNSLFQSGTYSGRAQILGPNNAIRLEPSVGFLFSERFIFSAGWGFFWRESSNDGLYGIPGNLIVPSNGVKSRYEGSRPIAQLDWQITRHLSAHVNYIYVFNATFEEQSVHGTTGMSFISPWVVYRF